MPRPTNAELQQKVDDQRRHLTLLSTDKKNLKKSLTEAHKKLDSLRKKHRVSVEIHTKTATRLEKEISSMKGAEKALRKVIFGLFKKK